ncbi:MAG: M48 family metalloprotease [Deltaproteobacteria bacterium]
MSDRRLLYSILCFLLIFPLLFPPQTANAFSVGEEKELGEKLLSVVRQQFTLLDDPDISQYINTLGDEIVKETGPQFFNFHFFVINNKEFNAFAAPSGLIFVHSGLIETMDNEDELYGVLAHEVGHVVSRHIARRMEKDKKMSIGTAALVLAGIAIGAGPLGEALITGSLAASESMNLHFSRQDEEEADRLAYGWMKEDNRDPQEMVSMLQKMVRISKYRLGNIPPYLLTHPEPERRVGYVQDLLYIDKGKHYPKHSEFAFQRFKARILSLCKDPLTLQARYLKQKKDGENGVFADYGLSLAYLNTAQYEKAIEAMGRVIAKNPEEALLLTDEGVIYYQMGDMDKALAYFQQARSMDKDDLYTVFNLARTYEQTGKNLEAVSLYEMLIDRQPDYAKAYMQLGQLKAKQKKENEAYYNLGQYYWLTGDSKRALESFKKCQALSTPSDQRLVAKAKEEITKIERLDKKF